MGYSGALTSANTSKGEPVGSYVRLSDDGAIGQEGMEHRVGEACRRQDEDNRKLAANLGWSVVRTYNDNDITASDPDVVRPQFEELLRDLEAGIIRGVVFWHADRFARLEYDAARVNMIFTRRRYHAGRAVTGGTDLSTVEGRSMFMIQATVGGIESHNIKRRKARANAAHAEAGRQHHGRTAFGWNRDGTLHEEHAKLLRDSRTRVVEGLSVGALRREWIAQGLEPARNTKQPGKQNLTHNTVELRLINPRNCGLRTYIPREERREAEGRLWLPDYVVYNKGVPVVGDWPTIYTIEEWEEIVAVIKGRKEARKNSGIKTHSTSVNYLLTGIAVCGACLFPLRTTLYTKGTNSYERYRFRYQCVSTNGGCGGVSRVGPPLDEHVEGLYLEEQKRLLGQPKRAELDVSVHDPRLAEIAVEMDMIRESRRQKKISVKEALEMIADLEAERNELATKRQALIVEGAKRRTDTPSILRDWESFDIPKKRHHLQSSIRAVVVEPVGRGKRFDPEFVHVDWK